MRESWCLFTCWALARFALRACWPRRRPHPGRRGKLVRSGRQSCRLLLMAAQGDDCVHWAGGSVCESPCYLYRGVTCAWSSWRVIKICHAATAPPLMTRREVGCLCWTFSWRLLWLLGPREPPTTKNTSDAMVHFSISNTTQLHIV